MSQLQQAMPISVVPSESHNIAATELRPWGSFTVLEERHNYKIKRIEVKPGHRLSLQTHYHRSEHWIIVSGTAKVYCADQETFLFINQSTYVPVGAWHRLENPGVLPLIMIEVQSGEYLGEDDIVRLQDDYARIGS
jgi:mannose-6-phosphate isomerase